MLALELYFDIGVQSATHPKIVALSEVLNRLDIHGDRPDAARFRNPSGVNLKLANFAALDPAYPNTGMQRGGRQDAEVFDVYNSRRSELAKVAAAIRKTADSQSGPPAPEPDEEEFSGREGRLLYRRHRTRERDSRIVAKKKAAVLKTHGRLACEACDVDFGERYGTAGEGYIECHHTIPLAEGSERVTRTEELALLCANCHRVVHRASPPLSLEQLRLALDAPDS